MKSSRLLAAPLLAVGLIATTGAQAADATIGGTIRIVGTFISNVNLPLAGRVGNLNLQNGLELVPGFTLLQQRVRGLGSGVPVVGDIALGPVLSIPEAITAFRRPLPGLDRVNGALETTFIAIQTRPTMQP